MLYLDIIVCGVTEAFGCYLGGEFYSGRLSKGVWMVIAS